MAYAISATYLQDYRRHSVAVGQKMNDCMQVYLVIMEGK